MARLHVFEFEDQSWFPGLLRAQMTDYLVYAVRLFRGFPSYAASRLAPVLHARASAGSWTWARAAAA